ncbi:unnamed protein product [Rotaria sp. Silwood2]|nr:unnamed protein product [Rotaria sp. Silwood2]CAF2869667.1 unnamed protein product [Rotaria sp. Silwood2]CAF3253632.1 unnamed protein product [Rotaria sp. Silwood2]CAF4024668.1 unnamed protein product [Rotaria sp. Silwood2]CAF4145980.1 unnamed protein product [Rotaria sp. Silwood2]
MHPQHQIDFVKLQVSNRQQPYYDAYRRLISYADAAFNHTTHALVDFAVPGYYIDPILHQRNSAGLQSDAFDAYACALAYCISEGQSKYANQSIRFLKAWADLNTKYSDYDGSLVMVYSGTAMVMAGELLLNYNGWNHTDKEKYLQWVRNVYLKASNEIRLRKNNWGDWGRFGSILSAHLLDNANEVTENIRLVKSDLFLKIAADGHMPEETVRGANGIWYTYFSLAPITATCWVAYQATGENLFTNYTQGNFSIKQALDYLYYYSLHPNEWPWFVNPNKGSPTSWPGNLLEAMSSIYGDNRYVDYVKSSRPLIYNKHHFAWAFPTLMTAQLGDYEEFTIQKHKAD